MRFGPRITFFRNYLFHTEVEVNPQEQDPFYVRMTDALRGMVAQSGADDHRRQAQRAVHARGRDLIQGAPHDRSQQPGEQHLVRRRSTCRASSVSGRKNAWTYRGSVYSSGAANREFGEFNGGVFTLAVLGYDFAKKLGVREAVLTGNYLYQQPDVNNTFTRRLRTHHVGPTSGWMTDAGASAATCPPASGYLGQRDIWSLMLMPYFNVTDKLQFVGRYTFVDSDGNNGVSLPTYESRVARGSGDEYSEGYLGVNYYFYGHRLKLQSGVEFGEMQDRANDGGEYSGTSWVTGLRLGW